MEFNAIGYFLHWVRPLPKYEQEQADIHGMSNRFKYRPRKFSCLAGSGAGHHIEVDPKAPTQPE